MTYTELDRDQVVAKLFELKNRYNTAQHFAVSKETLNRRLKEWGVETDFRVEYRNRVSKHNEVFKPGDIVVWAPRHARQGFFGHPLGKAEVECMVVKGPSKANHYTVETLNPVFAKTKTKHAVIGHSLRKLST